ncbi:hypothetical protein ACJ41O_006775 [Fusarium nematophilum]
MGTASAATSVKREAASSATSARTSKTRHSKNKPAPKRPEPLKKEKLVALGTIPGDCAVESPEVSSACPWFGRNLELTLVHGPDPTMWATFDLGVLYGTMFFEERPRRSSLHPVRFRWRGKDEIGGHVVRDDRKGWIKVLGDGAIEGWLDYGSLSFQGRRVRDGERTTMCFWSEWHGFGDGGEPCDGHSLDRMG